MGYRRTKRYPQRRNNRFGQNRRKRNDQKINVSLFINRAKLDSENPEKVFVPDNLFSDFALSSALVEFLSKNGYKNPTPIQDQIIGPILEGKDVVGLANTGTGKTAAFLIPLIEMSLKKPDGQILIIAPTRELALQVNKELSLIIGHVGLFSTVCVGGENMRNQMRKLKFKNHFIVGTPGRLLDLVKRGHIILGNIDKIVLDEADRMLDMGFIKDIRLLLNHAPANRQTLCFSATMSSKTEVLISEFLKDPITVSVKTREIPGNIEQDVISIRNLNKIDVLYDLLQGVEFKKVLVFGSTKRGVETLSKNLSRKGMLVESIHGDKNQTQRKKALLKFKENRVKVLIATDVAARGIHINDISHVINYEIPESYDDYVHRIGRTGRGVQKGKALTFVK